MVVLILGSSGFIGSRLANALSAAGHRVICTRRRSAVGARAACSETIHVDFVSDTHPAAWLARLAGVDALVNAVGIIEESGEQTFEALHVRAPQAVFAACARAGVRLVVQVSALGADDEARSAYHLTKRKTDEFLRRQPLEWVIVRPSLVYGAGGRSAQLFDALASAPVIPLPGDGLQLVQPVHVDDVIAGMVALFEPSAPRRVVMPFVGPRPLTLREFLAQLRGALGLPRARFLRVPMPLVRLASRFTRGLLSSDNLEMLVRGNVGHPEPLSWLLGRAPVPVTEFVSPDERSERRRSASLRWLAPLLRVSIALVWLLAGVVSLGLYPVEASLERLAQVGLKGKLASVALYGAAALDLLFAVLTLTLKHRRLLWLAQIAVILAYTSIISVFMPEQWLEPFGPIVKNLPMLAALWLLYAWERE